VLFLVSFLMLIFFWQTGNFRQPSLYEVGMVFLIVLSVLPFDPVERDRVRHFFDPGSQIA